MTKRPRCAPEGENAEPPTGGLDGPAGGLDCGMLWLSDHGRQSTPDEAASPEDAKPDTQERP